MKKVFFPFVLFLLLGTANLQAQKSSFGFKIGWNFSNLSGPSIMHESEAIDNFAYVSGFSFGAVYTYNFTDLFGLRTGLDYAQKGFEYNFEGPSYYIFQRTSLDPLVTTGTRTQRVNIATTNFEIPIGVVAKVGDSGLEFHGGAYISLMAGASGGGELNYSGSTLNGTAIDPFSYNLTYDYFRDLARQGNTQEFFDVTLPGEVLKLPIAVGAYFEDGTKSGNLLNVFDFGLQGGFSYFVNRGLYIGARASYGLVDITKNGREYSLYSLDDSNNRVLTEHKDVNISFQINFGFAF